MDSTSLERLAALKRKLPQKLPLPDQKPAQHQHMGIGRHPLETTQDPEELFTELIKASPDGHVPDHLLKRLRNLEQQSEGGGRQAVNQGVNHEQEQYRLFEALLGDGDESM